MIFPPNQIDNKHYSLKVFSLVNKMIKNTYIKEHI